VKVEVDPARLRAQYEEWPDDRLLRALALERDDFSSAALAIMENVLDGRGLAAPDLQDRREELRAARRQSDAERHAELDGVKGFLFLFILIVGFNSLFDIAAGIRQWLWAGAWLLQVAGLPQLALGAFGLFCAVALATRMRVAPAVARVWLVASLVIDLEMSVVDYVVSGEVLASPAGTAVFAALWLSYLARSKRVQVVYGHGDGSLSPV